MNWDLFRKGVNIFLLWRKEELDGKNPLYSRTIWINIIAVLACILSSYAGIVLTPEAQVGILALVNILLRFITKRPIGFQEDKTIEGMPDKNESNGSETKDSMDKGRFEFPTHTGDG